MSTAIGNDPGPSGAPGGDRAALAVEMDEANARFEGADAADVIAWAHERFADQVVLASSFQDAVLLGLAHKAAPGIEVVFLDTGFHFPETIAYMRRLEKVLELNITVLEPGIPADVEPCGSPNCCELRKVVPLNKHLEGKAGWITGLKRVDTPERHDAPIVAFDDRRGLVKINPLAAWTDDDIDAYVAEHGLPRHPLNYVGYISIGCAPTTRPVAPGEDPRAGRWFDTDKTECGLHL